MEDLAKTYGYTVVVPMSPYPIGATLDTYVQKLQLEKPDVIVANWFRESDAVLFSKAAAAVIWQLGASQIFGPVLRAEVLAQAGKPLEGYC